MKTIQTVVYEFKELSEPAKEKARAWYREAPSRPQIILSLEGDTWVADFVNDAKVRELFGTTKIPTPFTAAVDMPYVIEAIKETNPDCDVHAVWAGSNAKL